MRLAALLAFVALAAAAPAQATLVPSAWKDGQKRPHRSHPHQATWTSAAPTRPVASSPTSARPVTATAAVPAAAPVSAPADEQALVAAVNQARAANGLAALTLDSALQNAARAHTENLLAANAFTHDFVESGGSTAFAGWIHRFYSGSCAGENLAGGSPSLTAQQAVDLWLNSPGHRANLLSSRFATIGVALEGHNGTWIATADFGGC